MPPSVDNFTGIESKFQLFNFFKIKEQGVLKISFGSVEIKIVLSSPI
jgi:hypothetical protein